MVNIDINSRREQRNFGLVMCVGISVLGLLRWWAHGFGDPPMYFFYTAAAFAIVGLIYARALKPFFYVWMKFGMAINWVVTRVILITVFVGMMVPTRALMRIFAEDPLKRRWLPEAESYWEEAEKQPEGLDRHSKQF